MNKLDANAVELTGYKRYRALIFSLSLLSFMMVSIMLLSLYVSNQLEKDTKVINTAFEQTSLLNEIVSGLYIINSQYNVGQASSFTQKRLSDIIALMDQRILAFKNGGELPVVSIGTFNELDVVTIEPPTEELGVQMNVIWQTWNEYVRRVQPALSIDSKSSVSKPLYNRYQFYGAILHQQGAINGLSRLGLGNMVDRFALELQEESDQRSKLLGLIQIAGIVLTGISLVLILFFIVRQLRRSDSKLESAREQARGILNTVQEGLFLVHKDKTIGSEYSNELESILETNDIASRNLFDIMSRIIADKDRSNVDLFINSLFNPKVVASLIMDLNPLKELKVSIDNNDGGFAEKYLSFNFYRVTEKGVITDILVSVKDISDRILLQQKVDTAENKNDEQVKTLISLMKVNQETLKSFIRGTTHSLISINQVLKQPVSDNRDFRKKADKIFMHMHTIKGEASSIELNAITEKAHEFEDELERLKSRVTIDGMSFLPLTIKLEHFLSYMEELTDTADKMYGFNQSEVSAIQTADAPLLSDSATHPAIESAINKKSAMSNVSTIHSKKWSHLATMVNNVAGEYDKQVSLLIQGLDEVLLNDSLQQSLNSILVHLIKNSVVHGIETPEERLRKNKSAIGNIHVTVVELTQGVIEVQVRDDGQGIDAIKVAQALLDKGLATQEQINTWSSSEINKRIFSRGFSTANGVDLHAGRGVGLGAVYEMIKNIGGTLKVKQSLHEYCQFSISFPKERAL